MIEEELFESYWQEILRNAFRKKVRKESLVK